MKQLKFSLRYPIFNLLIGIATISTVVINQPIMIGVSADEPPQTSEQIPEPPESVREVTVRIEIRQDSAMDLPTNQGSGVIISKQGNKYTVLTADHVLFATDGEKYVFDDERNPKLVIVTNDGDEYEVLRREQVIRLRVDRRKGVDLALITFESSKEYQLARLAPIAERLDAMGVYGWPNDLREGEKGPEYKYGLGTINELNQPDYLGRAAQGYAMRYDAETSGGMSGGPVVDRNDPTLIVGIHGNIGAGSQVVISEITGVFDASYIQRRSSTAIPISTFVDQIPGSKPQETNWFFSRIPLELIANLKLQRTRPLTPQSINANNPKTKYIEGIRQIIDKKYSDAIISLLKAIDMDNKYAEAYLALGDAYHFMGDYEKAEKQYIFALQKAEELEKDEDNPLDLKFFKINSLFRLASINYLEALKKSGEQQQEYYNRALARINEIEKDYSAPEIYLNRALVKMALYGKDETDDLERALKIARQQANNKGESGNAKSLVSVGIFYYKYKNDKEKALDIWNEAIKATPKDSIIYLEIGKYIHRTGRPEEALKFWNQLEEKMSGNSDVKRELSDVYDYFSYDYPEYRAKALNNLNKAVEVDPSPEVYEERGRRRQQYNEPGAVDDLKEAYNLYTEREGKDSSNAKAVARQLCRSDQTYCGLITTTTPQQNNNQSSGQNTNPSDPKPPEQGDNPPIATITQTFYCDPTSGRVTIDRTENGDRPLIRWVSNRFTPWGYDPRLRCEQVSARLREYRASGDLDLNRITYGRVNRRTVLCIARPERFLESSATRCRGGLLILTLEPRQNPEQVLREFKQVLTGTYPNPPLRKELSNPASKE
ncbi:COP23 domain-containing protein [Aerosakkonema funiforme]|uniref:COP23 domain-containing protein n=1 Tax=Aerosakkonema funiforme TaxID=1246630 RepID=UPI0035B8CE8A